MSSSYVYPHMQTRSVSNYARPIWSLSGADGSTLCEHACIICIRITPNFMFDIHAAGIWHTLKYERMPQNKVSSECTHAYIHTCVGSGRAMWGLIDIWGVASCTGLADWPGPEDERPITSFSVIMEYLLATKRHVHLFLRCQIMRTPSQRLGQLDVTTTCHSTACFPDSSVLQLIC